MTAKSKWSADVTEHSDAMDLEDHIFESDDARKIAASLKRSADIATGARPSRSSPPCRC
jgi:hypothetical protein